MTNDKHTRVECEIAGKKLILETGHIARQAHGSVLVTYGETQCFAAAVRARIDQLKAVAAGPQAPLSSRSPQ